MTRCMCLVSLTIATAMGCGSADEPEPSPEPAIEEPAIEEPSIEEPAIEEPATSPPEIARPYEEGVDAQAQIDAAVASAATSNKRVLLMFGANWCVWCRRLDYVFQNDPTVAPALESHYQLVHVDVGARQSDTNRDVARRYGDPLSNGLPCLVVLDEQGEVAQVQETGSLEEGDHHDPALVLAFLNQWRGDTS